MEVVRTDPKGGSMNLDDFSPTVPTETQKSEIDYYSKAYIYLATDILIQSPSAHRTAALRLLLESKMTLIHGITHPQVS